jgi:uncharacterized protein YdaU (DUF1376 family)
MSHKSDYADKADRALALSEQGLVRAQIAERLGVPPSNVPGMIQHEPAENANPHRRPVRDTGHLRALLIGAYMLLLFHHWSTGSLPDDDEQLSAIARLTPIEWRKARPILIKFFGEGWRHGRIEKDLAVSHANYEKRAKAGEEGGKAKAAAKQTASKNVALLEPETSNALATDNLLPKKDAADAAPDPEVELFRRGSEVLGKQAGGMISKLLTAKQKNIALARAAIEQASTKSDPREYIGRIISGPQNRRMSRTGSMAFRGFYDGRTTQLPDISVPAGCIRYRTCRSGDLSQSRLSASDGQSSTRSSNSTWASSSL